MKNRIAIVFSPTTNRKKLMKNAIYLLAAALLLLILNSCSDDSGTDPSDELQGATFQFEDGMEWDYELYIDDEPSGGLFATTKSNGKLLGKESYKYYVGTSKMNIPVYNFTLRSIDSSGYYQTNLTGIENHGYFFPELKNQWIKYIDFENDSWTQFDLDLDSTFKDENRYRGHFKLSGQKISNSIINYKGKQHYSTVYSVETDLKILQNGYNYKISKRKLEITVLAYIGIYKVQSFEDGVKSDSYQLLIDHK